MPPSSKLDDDTDNSSDGYARNKYSRSHEPNRDSIAKSLPGALRLCGVDWQRKLEDDDTRSMAQAISFDQGPRDHRFIEGVPRHGSLRH